MNCVDFGKMMDRISEGIRNAEESMRTSNLIMPVSIGKLEWAKDNANDQQWRILFRDELSNKKPFIETKIQIRVELIKDVPLLIEEAKRAMNTMLKDTEKALEYLESF